MKIDLEDLERKARAATPDQWTTTKPPMRPDGWAGGIVVAQVYGGQSIYATPPGGCFPAADADHISANSPPITLALVARVRELETSVLEAAATIGELVTDHTTYRSREDDPDWHHAQRLIAVGTKGAVLP
jgi:hypothetical protein